MKVLHQIGDRKLGGSYNSLEEIVAHQGPISFDGVYMSVYENYKALKGKDVTFFFSGKYLGKNNYFDVGEGQPLSTFCTLDQILEMAEYLGAKVGYHGWAHLSCPKLSDHEIAQEIMNPFVHPSRDIQPILAWPYGDCDERCARIAKQMGYKEAWSVFPKCDEENPFMKTRAFLNWDHYDNAGNNLGKKQ